MFWSQWLQHKLRFSPSDVNECEETNGGCEALCCNTIGSFYCRCPPGLKLNEDGKTCEGESSALFVWVWYLLVYDQYDTRYWVIILHSLFSVVLDNLNLHLEAQTTIFKTLLEYYWGKSDGFDLNAAGTVCVLLKLNALCWNSSSFYFAHFSSFYFYALREAGYFWILRPTR